MLALLPVFVKCACCNEVPAILAHLYPPFTLLDSLAAYRPFCFPDFLMYVLPASRSVYAEVYFDKPHSIRKSSFIYRTILF